MAEAVHRIGAAPPSPILPLEAQGLVYAVRGRRLIDGLDLRLDGRGITIIMGPNGAGKSLLLRLLNGLIPPTEGRITSGGAALDTSRRRWQAMVFQTPVLLRRSVAANLDFVLRGRDAVAQRDRWLTRVGLAEKAGQPARLLSGGEAQRLALARALAGRPEILFLDEPTASLDPTSTLAVEEIVRDAQAAGTGIVFVTHDIGQARRLADEIVFLHRGRVAEHTDARSFLNRPSSEAGRAYLDGRIVL